MQWQLLATMLPYNTFKIDEKAEALTEIHTLETFEECRQYARVHQQPIHIVGGGSNILLTTQVDGCVLINKIKGIQVVHENDTYVHVKFSGGEIWHDCVLWAVANQLGGIENLSLIPGTIGAAPIQNIGAYGVELKDVFVSLEAIHIQTGEKKIFDLDSCAFGYRDSVFKNTEKNKWFIYSVTLQLTKHPTLQLSYGNILAELKHLPHSTYSLQDVSQAIINIRQAKLPNPAIIGNAGSFFKNPIISKQHLATIQQSHATIPFFEQKDGIKIPAAWLIEKTGWKGYREGDFGVHTQQALVLVNYGHARGRDIVSLSENIITSVQQVFNIELEREVNIW